MNWKKANEAKEASARPGNKFKGSGLNFFTFYDFLFVRVSSDKFAVTENMVFHCAKRIFFCKAFRQL